MAGNIPRAGNEDNGSATFSTRTQNSYQSLWRGGSGKRDSEDNLEGLPPGQREGNVSVQKSSTFSELKQIEYVKIPMSQGTKTKQNKTKNQQ